MQGEGIVTGIGVLHQRQKIAVFTIFATIGSLALVAVGEMLELAGVIDLLNAPEEPLALTYTLILLINFVAFVTSVIAVSMWIYRAHANLHEVGLPGLRFTPGWAVGWYFIPIAFLFKPFQAMRELWTESQQTGDSFSAPAPGDLSAWWGFWIVGNILGNVSTRLGLMGDGANMQITTALGFASSLCTIGAAWLLLGIVRKITAAQNDGIVAAQIFD